MKLSIFADLMLIFESLLMPSTAESTADLTVAVTSILGVIHVALLTIAAQERFGLTTFDAPNGALVKFGAMVQMSLVELELELELPAEAAKLLHVKLRLVNFGAKKPAATYPCQSPHCCLSSHAYPWHWRCRKRPRSEIRQRVSLIPGRVCAGGMI